MRSLTELRSKCRQHAPEFLTARREPCPNPCDESDVQRVPAAGARSPRLTHTRGFQQATAFPGAVPGHRQYPEMHCRDHGLNPDPIIDCRPDPLARSKVLLGCLNRDMAKQ